MRQVATNFINEWVAVELLAEAPSGETKEQLFSRFSRDAAAKGLNVDEIELMWCDPDMSRVIEKHGSGPHVR